MTVRNNRQFLKFKDFASKLTGLSIWGAQWEPPKGEIATDKSVVNFLEDRRVLYNPTELEMPDHCIQSILEIRRYLTQAIDGLNDKSPLKRDLKIMRAACRKFLDNSPEPRDTWHNGYSSWVFFSNLGELRGVFGICLGEIVLIHQLDIEQELASIIPASD